MACTASSGEAKAVIMMTGRSGFPSLTAPSSSRPPMPGMRISLMIRSNSWFCRHSRAFSPFCAVTTACPSFCRQDLQKVAHASFVVNDQDGYRFACCLGCWHCTSVRRLQRLRNGRYCRPPHVDSNCRIILMKRQAINWPGSDPHGRRAGRSAVFSPRPTSV